MLSPKINENVERNSESPWGAVGNIYASQVRVLRFPPTSQKKKKKQAGRQIRDSNVPLGVSE